MRNAGTLTCLVVALLVLGCGSETYQARYDAERVRYWAERAEIQFSLEANPQIRQTHYDTALRYLEMAQVADPSRWEGDLDEELRAELENLHGYARVRSGAAFLKAGQRDLGETQLELAVQRGPLAYRQMASRLRAEAAAELEETNLAAVRYREFFDALLEAPSEDPPNRDLLEIPTDYAFVLAEENPDSLFAWIDWGHSTFFRIQETWPEDPIAQRALFLEHRLEVSAENWSEALDYLERFEQSTTDEEELRLSRFNRAEIYYQGLGRRRDARELYAEIAGLEDDARPDEINGLARLRLADLLVEQGRVDDALDQLATLARSHERIPSVAAAAENRRGSILLDLGRDAEALSAFRRVSIRYGDTAAGLSAPLQIVSIYEKRGEPAQERAAIVRAEGEYRRLIAAHAVDSDAALQARYHLAECLVRRREPEEALMELDLIYHVCGPNPDGMKALEMAGRVAWEELDDPELARRYLERIIDELPTSRNAVQAQELLARLDAGEGPGPKIDNHEPEP